MIAILALLTHLTIQHSLYGIMFAGNALSFFCSVLCAKPLSSSFRWKWYFNELSGTQIIFLLFTGTILLELTALWKKEKILKSFTFWFLALATIVVFYNFKGLDDYNLLMIGLNPALAFCSGIKELKNCIRQFPGLWHFLSLVTMTLYGLILDQLKPFIHFINSH